MAFKKTTPEVIEALNEVLTAELTAINQYFVHAEMCENWGYERVAKRIRKEAIDEMKHAEQLIERILYLDSIPNVQRLGKINLGEGVVEAMRCDLALEQEAVARLNRLVPVVREAGDAGSALLLEEILEAEEEHLDWIEAQLEQVEQVGDQNYLAEQIRSSEG
jgi:bacterioferritin